jgi:hypothetical protein
MGRKVSDEFTVPLCSIHHRELHSSGNERRWWQDQGIDPEPIARELWRERQASQQGRPQQHKSPTADKSTQTSRADITTGSGKPADRAESNSSIDGDNTNQ